MIYILFHAKKLSPFIPCIDGLFAAYAAGLAHPDATLVPAMYEHPPKLQLSKDDRVFLLDLTYNARIIEAWADQGADVVVLDHHKQAMEDLRYLSSRIFKTFDMDRSGAVIAWEYFHPDKPVPELFRYVQDRDLWKKNLPDCDLVSLGIAESVHELSAKDAIALLPSLSIPDLISIGKTVKHEIDEAIAYAVAHHRTRCVVGHVVPFFNCRTSRQMQTYSDIGHALVKAHPKAPFAVVQTGGGWALRSESGRSDVAVIAKMLGGGGHQAAAGCRAELPSWLQWF